MSFSPIFTLKDKFPLSNFKFNLLSLYFYASYNFFAFLIKSVLDFLYILPPKNSPHVDLFIDTLVIISYLYINNEK